MIAVAWRDGLATFGFVFVAYFLVWATMRSAKRADEFTAAIRAEDKAREALRRD